MSKKVRISQVDALFSGGSYPIEFLFYYDRPFETRRLRAALRRLAAAFWPAFGVYADGDIVFDRYREAECFDELGVDGELEIPKIEASDARVISRFGLPPLERLFFLRVIRFRRGLALIPKLNHLAGDGYSYFFLLSLLAAMSRRGLLPLQSLLLRLTLKPHHRRTALRGFSFEGAGIGLPPQEPELKIQWDVVPRRDVRKIIEETASSSGLRVSTNDVLSALALKRLAGARAGPSAGDFSLTIPIDVRGKVKEYGRRFFGNGIMFHRVTFEPKTLRASPAREIAVAIRKSLPPVSTEVYTAFLRQLEETLSGGREAEFRPYDPLRGCLVTNLSKLPTHGLDFGTGAPRLIIPLTVEKNSAAILARNQDYLLRLAC
jgi:hypothetical protein